MAANAAPQQIVSDGAIDSYGSAYVGGTQDIPIVTGNTKIYITNTTETTVINVSSPGKPAGNTGELQFNQNGSMDGDDGLTYNPTTDSLTVLGNLTAGTVLTNNLKYANGTPYNFAGSNYSNSNVFAYLPTYVGNLNPDKVTATLFAGSGANLTNIPGANVTGQVSFAAVANSVSGSNVSGQVSYAAVANSVAGANVTGTVSTATTAGSASTAGTVTTAAQPNITSTGTLVNLTVSNASGTVNFVTSNVSLGAVANLHITGGSNGQVLTTNGSGTLSWNTPTVGNLQDVTTNGATTDQAVNITNTTVSTNFTTGALKVTGGVGISGNLHAQGHITSYTTVYAGLYADISAWYNPVFIGKDAGSDYIQGGLINGTDTGSADWVAYGDQSTTDTGWSDLGFTGSNFNDANYTITKPSDGYVFVQGLDASHGGPQGGNLVLATGDHGTHSDIVFAAGGFDANNEMMRLDHPDSTLYIGATVPSGTNVVNLDVNGNISLDGNLIMAAGNGLIQSIPNSSLDPTLPNVSTMVFTPDVNYNSQILVLDPTAPGHIHLRAFAYSNIDEPSANLYLGGENTGFEVTQGANNQVVIHSGGNTWAFGNDGRLTFPGTPRIDTSANNFEVQAAEAINFEANTVVNIYTDSGNTAYQWQFGDDGNLTLPGNTFTVNYANGTQVSLNGNPAGSSNQIQFNNSNAFSASGNLTFTDTSGGGTVVIGNELNLLGNGTIGTSNNNLNIQPAGNLVVTASAYNWIFDIAGNLTLPGNSFAVNYANGTQVSIGGYGNSNVTTLLGSFGSNSISTTGNVGTGNLSVTGTFSASGKIGYSSGSTVTQTTNRGQGVNINSLAGTIVTVSDSIPANDLDLFYVSNDKVDPATDIVHVQVTSYNPGTYLPIAQPVSSPVNGFALSITNITAFSSPTEAITIRFMVMKSPNS